jgi:hypothetical protein
MINKLAAALGWLLLAAITFSTLSPITLRPQTGHVVLERVLAYAAVGAAFGVGYPRRLLLATAITLSSAIGLEALQLVIRGRHARLIDAGEKLLGGLIGLGIAAVVLAIMASFRVSGETRT